MPIVFGAIVPHHPYLLSQEGAKRLPKTAAAMKAVSEGLRKAKPDILLVINTHEPLEKEVFLLNVAAELGVDLSEFGVVGPFRKWKGTMEFSSHLRQVSDDVHLPIQMVTENVGMAVSVPLASFNDLPGTITVLPIHTSGLSLGDHAKFGMFLCDQSSISDKRIAVLCSAELASSGDKSQPESYHPEGETYNELALAAIQDVSSKSLEKLDRRIVDLAGTCGYESLVTFLACISRHFKAPASVVSESVEGVTLVTAIYQ